MNELPKFPVDNQTLGLLLQALNPGPDVAERTSLYDLLDLYSQLGGSDPEAVAEVIDVGGSNGAGRVVVMRDPSYHHNDVILALVKEVRRLRARTKYQRRTFTRRKPCSCCGHLKHWHLNGRCAGDLLSCTCHRRWPQ